MPKLRDRAAHFVFKKLGFFDRSYTETAFGRSFTIPIINGRKTYVSEPWMFSVIKQLFSLKPGGFIDVGVNLGQTMLKVAAADPDRRYVGFEPNPTCADYAVTLASANRLPYVIVPAGLGDKSTVLELQLYGPDDTDPSASMVAGFREKACGSRHISVYSAGDLPEDLLPDAAAIVKIDVEGGEAWVIDGLKDYLAAKRPFVLVEILPAYSPQNTARIERQQHIERTLADLGYAMFRVTRGSDELFKGLQPIDEIGIHGDLSMVDYLMAPREDVGRLAERFA
jgi:FkbM family methyltransferase